MAEPGATPSDRCRYCCIRVPDLLLASELRAHPELAERPIVVASGPGPGAEIVSVSRLAARQGVRRGASTAQARTVCAELCVRIASPALERAARDALLDVALSFSPRAAAAPLHTAARGVPVAPLLLPPLHPVRVATLSTPRRPISALRLWGRARVPSVCTGPGEVQKKSPGVSCVLRSHTPLKICR